MISKDKIIDIQKQWSNGLLKIVKEYKNGNNHREQAKSFIAKLYDYENDTVLFKPTLASKIQFRTDEKGALSYFIGENPNYSEDTGFALKNWKAVRWENTEIKIFNKIAIAMGNYYFLDEFGIELKVEYSFVYKIYSENSIKIILHDSHLPYNK